MYLVTTEEMRRLEQAAVDAGTTWATLMERAGTGVAKTLMNLVHLKPTPYIMVLVGPGNNGGDGLVAARYLALSNLDVTAYIWNRNPEGDAVWQQCRDDDIDEMLAEDDPDCSKLADIVSGATVVIDALLGMGCNRPLEGQLATIVETINRKQRPLVLSVDVPTGVQSDTGQVMGNAIRAHRTVVTGLLKRGLMLYPGRASAGTLSVVDIGIPSNELEKIMSETIDRERARPLLPPRPPDAHKGTFGKVMVVAGSLHYPGAAVLASTAAARVGAGLVTLSTARSIVGTSGRAPEVTLLPLPEAELGTLGVQAAEELLKNLEGYRALLVGPGLGREKATRHFLARLLGLDISQERPPVGFHPADSTEPRSKRALGKGGRVGFAVNRADEDTSSTDADADADTAAQPDAPLPPMVIDADGLNLLAECEAWHEQLPREAFILTPHPGEMKRLLQVDELDADVVQVASNAAQQWGQVVVLKGATTVVAAPDGRSAVYGEGNPALASAGTGDVLAGAIAGLLAQGMALFDAATLAVYIHAQAGVLVRDAMGNTGTLASDLLPNLPLALRDLRHRQPSEPFLE